MTNVAKIHNRILKRIRFVPNAGWITSSDVFNARVQPKVAETIVGTKEISNEELYLNTLVFRDCSTFYNSFVQSSYTFPTSGDAVTSAASGIDLVIGDRIFEEESGKIWITRSIAEYRDSRLKHDEIVCSEASHLDLRWIEPISILSITNPITGSYYDPVRRQFVKLEKTEMNSVLAFGIIGPHDRVMFYRDVQLLNRTEVGKELNYKYLIDIDADFPVDENSILEFKGRQWKVEFIRDTIFRVNIVGVMPYKQNGMTGNTINHISERNIVI